MDKLEPFNGQIVALLKVDAAPILEQDKLSTMNADFENHPLSYELAAYGLVRNIDLEGRGLHIILTQDPGDFNCIHLCDNAIFSFASSYIIQPDLQEEILRKAMIDDTIGAQDRYYLTDFSKITSGKE